MTMINLNDSLEIQVAVTNEAWDKLKRNHEDSTGGLFWIIHPITTEPK